MTSRKACTFLIVGARRAQKWRDGSMGHAHLARRRLDLDFVWRDQLRPELAAPLDGALDALPRFVKFPLGSTQVAQERVRLIKPSALPRRI